MNIQQIKNLTTVDGWVDFENCQIIEVKESKPRTKKNRMMTKVKLSDTTDIISAWLYTDTQQITLNQVISGNGMLKEYQRIRYLDYASIGSQQSQQAPQQAPQAAQQAARRPNPPQNVSRDARSISIERQCAFKAACTKAHGTAMTDNEIINLAKAGQYFIETGNNLADVPDYPPQGDQSPPTGDDIPF